jgi:hypothetical protein
VDDAASAAMLNVAPVSASDAGAVAGAIRAARSAAGPVTSVLLVGGPDVIPFFSVGNPVANDDDTEILTDNPYRCAEADERMYAAPDVPVGRVVGSRDGGLDSLIAHLGSMAALHRSAAAASGALAFGCSVWEPFTTAVLSAMDPGGAILTSPSDSVSASTAMELRRRLLYFNLHGLRLGADWLGADANRFYDCVSPAILGTVDLPGAVIFAANCYGAAIDRTTASSCALTAIRAGAQTFIGATCLSFGSGSSSSAQPLFSDRLAQLFFGNYAGGESAGQALVDARIAYVRENLIQGLLNPWEYKTAMEFIFLGDPTL